MTYIQPQTLTIYLDLKLGTVGSNVRDFTTREFQFQCIHSIMKIVHFVFGILVMAKFILFSSHILFCNFYYKMYSENGIRKITIMDFINGK